MYTARALRRPKPEPIRDDLITRILNAAIRAPSAGACRALGLGTLITTNHILYEEDARAVLALPDYVFTFALMPIGYPIEHPGPLSRRPVAEVTFAEKWRQSWPSESCISSG
jgi:nitroreductase